MKICTECKIIGLNSNGDRIMKCKFICDTYADIPTATEFQQNTGCIIAMGSEAHIIYDNADYELQSSGFWTLSQAGTAAYTKSEVDQKIAEIDILRQGEEIPDNADLNTYTEIGAFYSPNSARTSTIYNRPWSGSGFKLIVLSISSVSKMHILLPISNNADSLFFRSRTTSGFRPWYKIQGSQVDIINPM